MRGFHFMRSRQFWFPRPAAFYRRGREGCSAYRFGEIMARRPGVLRQDARGRRTVRCACGLLLHCRGSLTTPARRSVQRSLPASFTPFFALSLSPSVPALAF